jgi:hypothetical protein
MSARSAPSIAAPQWVRVPQVRNGSNPVFEVMSAARPLFHRKRKSICGLAKSAPTSLLADQQKKRSDANQHRNQNTDEERNNPMPTGLDFFRSSAFLRRSEPNQNRSLSIAISAVIGAAL